jgi:hypothetical protein
MASPHKFLKPLAFPFPRSAGFVPGHFGRLFNSRQMCTQLALNRIPLWRLASEWTGFMVP